MKSLLMAVGAVTALAAAAPASSAQLAHGTGLQHVPGIIQVRGYDYGPMGQCFDARVCGYGRRAYACSTYLERVVTGRGHVIFK